MSNRNCDITRKEVDEVRLGDELSGAASKHLRECIECHDFRSKQTKLREIVGSLGTVTAPPDFDFKLRARLAGDTAGSTYHMRGGYWPTASRILATVAAIIVVVATVVGVRQLFTSKPATTIAERKVSTPAPSKDEGAPVERVQPGQQQVTPATQKNLAVNSTEKPSVVRSGLTDRKPKRIVAADFSNEVAPVIKGNSLENGTAIPITAAAQSFTVSLEDSRGNARKISVPTVSFGSQRLLTPANQFVSKGSSW